MVATCWKRGVRVHHHGLVVGISMAQDVVDVVGAAEEDAGAMPGSQIPNVTLWLRAMKIAQISNPPATPQKKQPPSPNHRLLLHHLDTLLLQGNLEGVEGEEEVVLFLVAPEAAD